MEGMLIVYVDDLAFLAAQGLCKSCVNAVQSNWKTSEPEWFGEKPVTFLSGLEKNLSLS